MHGMELSIFADADLTVAVAPRPRVPASPRPRVPASPRPHVLALAAPRSLPAPPVTRLPRALPPCRWRRSPTRTPTVDAVLTTVTPRIKRIARLFVTSWPVAHVKVEDLTQEVLLEVAASLQEALDTSDAHTQAWLSSLAIRVLQDLSRAAAQDAAVHRAAKGVTAQHLATSPPFPGVA